MARICEKCGKGTVVGHSQKHRRGVAGKRWKNRVTPTPRLFRANIQMVTEIKDGRKVRRKLCAKCIKRKKRDASVSFAQI